MTEVKEKKAYLFLVANFLQNEGRGIFRNVNILKLCHTNNIWH